MPSKEYPSFDYIRQCLRYDDGVLFWMPRPRWHFSCEMVYSKWGTRYAGRKAGNVSMFGRKGQESERCVIILDGFRRYRYQFVWAIFNNEWVDELDHIDLISTNDRISNLRTCTSSQNKANQGKRSTNTSGLTGVRFKKDRSKWQARLADKHLGYYLTKEEAETAYETESRAVYNEFYRKK
jgi:hypothetical protein